MNKQELRPISAERRQYLKRRQRRKGLILTCQIGVLVLFFALWEVAGRLGWIDSFILSMPSRMVATFVDMAGKGFFGHIWVTVYETLVGFTLGVVIGVLLAIVLWWSGFISKVSEPYLVVLNSLPKIALGPILIVWFGAGITSIIVMALLISFVVTIMSVLAGFNEITGEKQLLMKTLGASKLQIFTMVVLPASLPTIMNALKISVGMSWVGVIVGEYLVSKAGLGYLIVYGGQVFKLDLVMASIVVLCLLAALMYYGVAYMEKKLVRWRMHGG